MMTSKIRLPFHSIHSADVDADCELLRQNLERAMQAFLENKILIKEFSDMKLDFRRILQEEAQIVFKKYK